MKVTDKMISNALLAFIKHGNENPMREALEAALALLSEQEEALDIADKPKQTLLDFMGIKQYSSNQQIFSDRDDYTRWLVGEISAYLEQNK